MVHEPHVNSVSAADKGSLSGCLATRLDANGRTADRIRLYGPSEIRSTWRRLSRHINAKIKSSQQTNARKICRQCSSMSEFCNLQHATNE